MIEGQSRPWRRVRSCPEGTLSSSLVGMIPVLSTYEDRRVTGAYLHRMTGASPQEGLLSVIGGCRRERSCPEATLLSALVGMIPILPTYT